MDEKRSDVEAQGDESSSTVTAPRARVGQRHLLDFALGFASQAEESRAWWS